MTDRRIAITGLGCVSAVGMTADETWAGLKAGHCGIGPLTDRAEDLKVTIGGEIPGDITEGFPPRQLPALDPFTIIALRAARQAMVQAGLTVEEDFATRVGCIIGVGYCGMHVVEEGYRNIFLHGGKRAHLMTVPRTMPVAPAGQISMEFGIKGPVYGVTSACASANHAIGAGYQAIKAGLADVVVVGGTDSPLIWGILKGWDALRVLAADACRPFSLNRRGLALADGAGVAVLERWDHAKARGATILAELAGAGMTADAADLVMPGIDGPSRAIEQCLQSGDIAVGDVDYVNAHGTGTKANDSTETRIIRNVFGARADDLAVSSTKSMHGHALGGSGAIELVACVNAINEGVVPPTVNYDEPDPDCDLDVTPNVMKKREIDVAISNSFAFGGTNAVIAVRKA